LFPCLEGFVVGELDDVRLGREKGLVDVHLRVGVDGVVADVEELDDLGLGELFDDTFTACKFFLKLAWVLDSQKLATR
jgi:hypothetical protein